MEPCVNKNHYSKIQISWKECWCDPVLCPNGDNEDAKEEFYNRLRNVLDKTPCKYIKILMGDTNTNVGSDNTGREEIIGMHGLGTMNKNGELFADFCTFNDLVIGGSVFPHKMMHKATLVSPDGKTENQIDRITISRKWRRSLLETCTSKERSRCGIRPPPTTRKCENKAEEIRRLSKLTTTTTIQCSQAKVKRKTTRVQLCCEEQV